MNVQNYNNEKLIKVGKEINRKENKINQLTFLLNEVLNVENQISKKDMEDIMKKIR